MLRSQRVVQDLWWTVSCLAVVWCQYVLVHYRRLCWRWKHGLNVDVFTVVHCIRSPTNLVASAELLISSIKSWIPSMTTKPTLRMVDGVWIISLYYLMPWGVLNSKCLFLSMAILPIAECVASRVGNDMFCQCHREDSAFARTRPIPRITHWQGCCNDWHSLKVFVWLYLVNTLKLPNVPIMASPACSTTG